MTDTAYNPREDTNEYVLTGLLDNLENGAIGSWNWLQERMEDDPNSWDDDVWRFMGQRLGGALLGAGVGSFGGPKGTLIGGLVGGVLGAERSATILSNVPGMRQLANAQDKLAGGARELNEKLTPWLDPRVAGWGTRILTDWALERGVRGGITKVKRNLTPGTVYAATDKNLIKSMVSDVDNPKAPLRLIRSDAEPVTQALVKELRSMHGGTKEQAAGFLATQKQGLKDMRAVIRFLNVKALQQEPKNLLDFVEAMEVALGRKVDPKDFIGGGKTITYKSAKGKQIIKDLDSLEKALFDRLEVVGQRGKGHFSLGHVRAVQNLIEQGDIGANRVTNLEPEVLRSVLQLTDASSDQIEELRVILGNSARKNQFDKPDQILTAQGVSRTINEEYLKYIEPKLLGTYWGEVLPRSHHEWFEDAVEDAVKKKVEWSKKLKKVKSVEEGDAIIRKIRQEVMEDYLNAAKPFGDAFEKLRESGLDKIIMREAPEIIVDHLEVIKNKVVWVPPTKGPDFNKLQRFLQRGDDMTFPPGMGLE